MKTRNVLPESQTTEETSITLPANALETLISSAQLAMSNENINGLGAQLLYGATAGRSETFPCVKKSIWSDKVQLRMVHN